MHHLNFRLKRNVREFSQLGYHTICLTFEDTLYGNQTQHVDHS